MKALGKLAGFTKKLDDLDTADGPFSGEVEAVKSTINPILRFLNLKEVSGTTPVEVKNQAISLWNTHKKSIESASKRWCRAVTNVMYNGRGDARVMDQAIEMKDDPTKINIADYIDLVMREGDQSDVAEISQPLMDFTPMLLARNSLIRTVESSSLRQCPNPNGHVVGARAAVQIMSAGSVIPQTGVDFMVIQPASAYVGVSDADDVNGGWFKWRNTSRMGAIFFHDGSANADYDDSPEFLIVVPSGVPQGSMVLDFDKYDILGISVPNSGAGAGLTPDSGAGVDYFGIQDTTAEVVVNVEGVDIATFSPSSMNSSEKVRINVDKSYNASKSISVKLNFTNGSTRALFGVGFDYRYQPSGVVLEDLLTLKISPAVTDPVVIHVERLMHFSKYLREQGLPEIHEIMSNRLNTNIPASYIHPDTWQSITFPVANSVWLDTYISVMNDMTKLAMTQPAFLSNEF